MASENIYLFNSLKTQKVAVDFLLSLRHVEPNDQVVLSSQLFRHAVKGEREYTRIGQKKERPVNCCLCSTKFQSVICNPNEWPFKHNPFCNLPLKKKMHSYEV